MVCRMVKVDIPDILSKPAIHDKTQIRNPDDFISAVTEYRKIGYLWQPG